MKFCNADITKVAVLDDYKLHLEFEDGTTGEVDISKIITFDGIFAALKDKSYFSRVHVNKDIGTICWENGADLSPALLHKKMTRLQSNNC